MKSILVRPIVSGILAATLLTLSVPTVLGAQAPDGGQFLDSAFGHPRAPARLLGPLFRVLHRLNLTPDQRGQIREILQGHLDDFRTLVRSGIKARRVLFEAVFLDPFDEGVIRDRSAAVGAVQADEAVLRATIRTQIFGVLTPDQQARATQALQEFERRMREPFDSSFER